MSEYSYGFETRVSEYGLSESLTGSVVLCREWPSPINRPVRYMPRKVPRNGNMNFRKCICKAESTWSPIQKAPPMQPGMITNITIGNLTRNSMMLVLVFCIFFSIATSPKLIFQRQQ